MIDLIRTDKGETPALGVSVRVGIDYDDYDLLVFAHEIQRTDSELARTSVNGCIGKPTGSIR